MDLPADWKGHPDGTPKIVSAVATLTGIGGIAIRGPELIARIEQAMAAAVMTAGEDGLSLSNPDHADQIRARMLAARQDVLDGRMV